ncbi:MAG: glycosyltransferase [Thermoleophilia bacterium]
MTRPGAAVERRAPAVARADDRAAARRGVVSFPDVIPQNPYQRLLYEHLAAEGIELVPDGSLRLGQLVRSRRRVGYLHFHWPQSCYRRDGAAPLAWAAAGLFAVRLAAARALGYRIVWTIHQPVPHESRRPRLDRLAAHALGRLATTRLAHDAATAAAARPVVGGRPVTIVPHGSYVGVYPPGRSRDAVRADLGIEAGDVVFLAFGHVRAYKSLDVLLDAFARLEAPHARLVIAGLPVDDASARLVESAAARDPRIVPVLRFVDDAEVTGLFAAADAAVVSRGDGGTSGSIVLALSLGVPVVAAALPAYAELLGGGAAGWAFAAGNPGSLRAALADAATDGTRDDRAAAARALAEERAWPAIAAATAAAMRGRAA